jgi:hypothetical protein
MDPFQPVVWQFQQLAGIVAQALSDGRQWMSVHRLEWCILCLCLLIIATCRDNSDEEGDHGILKP